MALNLREAAKAAADEGNMKKAGIIQLYAESSDILDAMTFMTIRGNSYKYDQEGSLPGVAFRGVNEAYTPSTGVINPQVESLVIAGGDLDVDNFIETTMGTSERSRQETMKTKALAADITDKILTGDSTSDPRELDGWQTRVTGSQKISNDSSSGGGALSLTKLDELIDQVNGPTHLIMNRDMRRRFIEAARSSTFANITHDRNELGTPIARYAGIPILVGWPRNDNTEILPFSEAYSGGGGSTGTSIYAVAFRDDGVMGLQAADIDVRDLGELDTQPQLRTRIEWYIAMAIFSKYAIARLHDIQDASIAA